MPHPKHEGRRVLVVAGSTEVRAALAQSLASAGCVVELAETAARVRQLATTGQIALAMLSPEGLPSEGGAEVARVLAARVSKLILIRPLHAASPTQSFEADGVVRDPFDRSEVLEQITHLLPRLPGSGADDATAGSVLRFDDLSLDLSGHTLLGRDGVEIRLTRSELALLSMLARRPGQTISRDELRNVVAGRDLEPYERSIDVLVARLRRKIERDHSTQA